MENSNVSKNTISFGLAVALCAVLNALLVIVKEESKPVTAWMQKATGHHWITHVLFILVAFIVFGLIFTRAKPSVRQLTNVVIAGVIASTLIILGFYIFAD
jgi:hypothetical protein